MSKQSGGVHGGTLYANSQGGYTGVHYEQTVRPCRGMGPPACSTRATPARNQAARNRPSSMNDMAGGWQRAVAEMER